MVRQKLIRGTAAAAAGTSLLVLGVVGLVATIAGSLLFSRRDLP